MTDADNEENLIFEDSNLFDSNETDGVIFNSSWGLF